MECFLFFHFKQTLEHPQRRAQPFNHEQSLFLERREVALCIGQLDPGLTDQLAGLQFRLLNDEIRLPVSILLYILCQRLSR